MTPEAEGQPTAIDSCVDGGIVGKTFSGCLIERKLGAGGMGTVYVARRLADGLAVVVKFLAPEQAQNKVWRARFVREAQMMQRVQHPNIVRVFSVEGDSDLPHIVMELVSGHGLDVILRKGPMKPRDATRVARDMALGLAEAHKNGIIHRDIKPANVLLTERNEVKVLDFGLAKNVEADDGLSLPGQILGTPHYMAPEQWGDHKVDARCDVFSLGVTLYHLVTGLLPFPGESKMAIQKRVLEGSFTAPRALAPEASEDLELVIFRMLATDRTFRYQTAEQCAKDLDRVLAGEPVEVPRVVDERDGKRHALLPSAGFTLGRDTTCDIVVLDRSVSRQHARIERGRTGFVLRDLGSSYGSFVAGMRVKKEVVLKDGDELKLGLVGLRFHDGGIGKLVTTTRRIEAGPRSRALPVPFLDALIESGDRRTVLTLLEELAPDSVEARVQATRATVRHLLGGDLAEQVAGKVEAKLARQRSSVPSFLFAITHENLGDDIEAWLTWWDNASGSYPPQIAPQQSAPQPVLRILRGEAEPRALLLEHGNVFAVGRDEKSQVQLSNPSVSRLHATILRLHHRLVIRDEGSRLGTVVNDSPVKVAFLTPGDRIVLGKVELTFEVETPDAGTTKLGAEEHAVDPWAFLVLEDLKHPATALGLIRLLEVDARGDWIAEEAARLFDPAKAAELAKKVQKTYATHAKKARELLPGFLGAAAESPATWHELLARKAGELPPQIVPAGWFPAPRSEGGA